VSPIPDRSPNAIGEAKVTLETILVPYEALSALSELTAEPRRFTLVADVKLAGPPSISVGADHNEIEFVLELLTFEPRGATP
jgi:hypothetical protein